MTVKTRMHWRPKDIGDGYQEKLQAMSGASLGERNSVGCRWQGSMSGTLEPTRAHIKTLHASESRTGPTGLNIYCPGFVPCFYLKLP